MRSFCFAATINCPFRISHTSAVAGCELVANVEAVKTIANEFANSGVGVLLLEIGGLKDEAGTQALYEIESFGALRTIDQEFIRRRIFGGSSHVWSARCAPFDPVDFEKRSWVPYSGWPVTDLEIDPFVRRASTYLGLGQYGYDEGLWEEFKVLPPSRSLNPAFFGRCSGNSAEARATPNNRSISVVII